MRQPTSDIPGLILSERGRSRIAFLPADVDRRYHRQHLPDHGNLLANTVRWAAGEALPLLVDGPGLIDCHLYRQGARWILHLVNLTNPATWRAPMEEFIPVGPVRVAVQVPEQPKHRSARLLVSGSTRPVTVRDGRAVVEVGSLTGHEVVVSE
jgi:hypothetical protein